MTTSRGGGDGTLGSGVWRTLQTLWSGPDAGPERRPALVESPRLLTPRAFRVCFVSDPAHPSHEVRTVRYMDALGRAGIGTALVEPRELRAQIARVPLFDVVVVRRLPASELLDDLHRRCRRAGVPIVYDVDDLVFEPDALGFATVDALRFLSPADLARYRQDVHAYRRALLDADACTVPTEFLATGCRALGKEVFLLPNAPPPPTGAAPPGRREDVVRLGYFSGSQTHQRDVATIAGPLARVMAAHPAVHLTIVGELDFSELPELLRFLPRVEHRPLVPADQLGTEIARVDVSLAPLEVGNPYCEAKSELKFLEAAAVGVPVVAAATTAFRGAIRHGETGLLATTADEWEQALGSLVVDRTFRERIGTAARRDVATRWALERLGAQARDAHAAIIGRARARRGAPEAALAVTLVIPPYAQRDGERRLLGGARALVEAGHEVRLVVHGDPAAIAPARHALWEDGHLGPLRFAGGTSDLACTDILISTTPTTADVVRASAHLAARAVHLAAGDDAVAGDARLAVVLADGDTADPAHAFDRCLTIP